jgi:hypothetical protein
MLLMMMRLSCLAVVASAGVVAVVVNVTIVGMFNDCEVVLVVDDEEEK